MSGSTDEVRTGQLLSWWPGTFDRAKAAEILTVLDLGFTPKSVEVNPGPRAGKVRPVRWGPGAVEVLADPAPFSWSIVAGNGWGQPNIQQGPLLECDRLDSGPSPMPASTVEALIQLDGFTLGAEGDTYDRDWESETDVGNYETFGRPHSHLPRGVPYLGDETIDVSGNAGRLSFAPGLRMWAGTDVWFGPAAGRVMDYAKVPTIPVGTLTGLPNDRYHLHLFDLGDPIEEIREKQAALRAHLDWDRIEAEAPSDDEMRRLRADD